MEVLKDEKLIPFHVCSRTGQGLWSCLTGAGNGLGVGYTVNAVLPIYPSPLVGMQGCVCTARKA